MVNKTNLKTYLVMTAFLLWLGCATAAGEVIYVDANGTADFETIQEAINDSNTGDEIIVAEGTYVENINFMGKNIILVSTDPNDPDILAATIIDGNDANSVVTFSGTESSDCVLSGFTITGGREDSGGGIYGNHTMATIENNAIVGNIATGGPDWDGQGGGIYACDGIIRNNIISNNFALYSGGGIYALNGIIQNNLIYANWALLKGGGGISCFGNYPDFNECPIITNCTIVNNWSGNSRMGEYGHGGGVYFSYGNHHIISNCIIRGNIADNGPQIALVDYSIDPVEPVVTATATYNDIQGGQAMVYTHGYCDLIWGPGNIDADPCFVEPGFWDPNGTPEDANDDFWVDGDYHLQSQAGRWDPNTSQWVIDANTSVCIDAGNPGCPLGDEPNDVNNVRINMGAYGGTAEASKSPANWRSIADLTNDWVVDFNDLEVFVHYWLASGQCIPSDLNRSESVDFVDFAVFTQQPSQPSNTPVAEPGIAYEITPCDLGLLAAEQSDQTRFTVMVEGSYIHFEDMMVANCCPDELELEMIVEDNLITIYEIERTTIPCLCICDFPVTATLGPFEPGTYTLEVYEDWGGFIGSTIVIID